MYQKATFLVLSLLWKLVNSVWARTFAAWVNQRVDKEKFFFMEEFQLIYEGGMIELNSHHFAVPNAIILQSSDH